MALAYALPLHFFIPPGAPAANSTFFCESPYLGRDTQIKCYLSYATGATFFNGNIECQKYGGTLVQYERYAPRLGLHGR